jgi:hypothetical protein
VPLALPVLGVMPALSVPVLAHNARTGRASGTHRNRQRLLGAVCFAGQLTPAVRKIRIVPLAIVCAPAHNAVHRRGVFRDSLGGLLMSHVEQSRLRVEAGDQHQDGRPYHFSSPSQEDRIRKVFGVADEAPLPPVDDGALTVYFDHLAASLAMPFEALYCQNGGEMRQLIHYVRVTELLDPRQARNHNLHGLFCKAENLKEGWELPLAELGVRDDNPNCQLIDDYAYWFVNCR